MGEWMYRSTFCWPRHLFEMSGQLHDPGSFNPGKKATGTHSIGSWVGPRSGVSDVEWRTILPLPRLELRPARSQSLYRLSYPGYTIQRINNIISFNNISGYKFISIHQSASYLSRINYPCGTRQFIGTGGSIPSQQVCTAISLQPADGTHTCTGCLSRLFTRIYKHDLIEFHAAAKGVVYPKEREFD
jgi:hypothetical protein